MSKVQATLPPAANVAGAEDSLQQQIARREESSSWKALPDSTPAQFMDMQAGMCRWPLGDPHNFESFRFCGCACAPEATYCATHAELAAGPQRNRAVPFRRGLQTPSKAIA